MADNWIQLDVVPLLSDMTQQIVLIRHGKPLMPPSTRICGNQLYHWVAAYNTAPLDICCPPPAEAIQTAAQCRTVVCSDLRRSRQSAHLLAPETIPIAEPLFREAELPFPSLQWPARSATALLAGTLPPVVAGGLGCALRIETAGCDPGRSSRRSPDYTGRGGRAGSAGGSRHDKPRHRHIIALLWLAGAGLSREEVLGEWRLLCLIFRLPPSIQSETTTFPRSLHATHSHHRRRTEHAPHAPLPFDPQRV